MNSGQPLCDDSRVVRALYSPFWNEAKNRGTTSSFAQSNVSVSCLDFLSYEEILEKFRRDIKHPIQGTATFVVGQARALVFPDPKNSVNVHYDPIGENDSRGGENVAHAELRAYDSTRPGVSIELTRGMANKILEISEHQKVVDL